MTFDLKPISLKWPPKADISCLKTYKKWYYIIFYFKKTSRDITFIRFHGRFGGHILNLTSRDHQRSRPFCLRWILKKKHCPYLTPCKISKTCHHTLYEVLVIRSLWFPSRYHSKLLNRYGLGNCTKQIGYLDVIAMFVIAYNKPRLRQSGERTVIHVHIMLA